jgi:hypothetical protein
VLKSSEAQMDIRANLIEICDAFNAHDLDRIMSFFADDCVLEMPRGNKPYGSRFEGKQNVRQGLAVRFEGLPDVHYGGTPSILWIRNLKPAFRNGASPALVGMARSWKSGVATSTPSATAKCFEKTHIGNSSSEPGMAG